MTTKVDREAIRWLKKVHRKLTALKGQRWTLENGNVTGVE